MVTGEEAAGSDAIGDNDALIALLNGAKDKAKVTASLRWAITVGSDHNLELVLQALPAAATVLDGKPSLRG